MVQDELDNQVTFSIDGGVVFTLMSVSRQDLVCRSRHLLWSHSSEWYLYDVVSLQFR